MPLPAGAGGWFALYAAISALSTWGARRYALHRDLLDHPGERRSHRVATPRGGGIGVVFVLLAALATLGIEDPGELRTILPAAIGLLCVAGIGWLDDHRPLSPWSRLLVHAFAAALLALAAWLAGGSPLSVVTAFVLAMVLANIWNFMDGIDGIAALQALVVAFAAMLLFAHAQAAWIAMALAAGCVGFLPFNFPRARIFLGDVGSGAIGYALAIIATMAMTAPDIRPGSTWVLLLVPCAFLVDAALTLGRRIVASERWWTPHVGHAYQRWANALQRHWPVSVAYTLWAGAGAVLALLLRDQGLSFIMCAGITWYVGAGIFWLVIQLRAHKVAKDAVERR